MLTHLVGVGCIFICTMTLCPASSTAAKSVGNSRKSQRQGGTGEEKDPLGTELIAREFPSFDDRASLIMLDDITAKVWRILPVLDVPRSWVITYCTKYTEIYQDVEKSAMRCRHDGTDWDCAFIELGGGWDDFNMGKIVSSFNDLSDRGLRLKLLRGAEICGKLWQRYKRDQDKRLTRMQLNVHVKDRRKRFLGMKKNERDEELRKERQAVKEIRDIRRSLMNKIRELESKSKYYDEYRYYTNLLTRTDPQLPNSKNYETLGIRSGYIASLTFKEEKELDQLHLTVAAKSRLNLEEYPLAEDRTELSRLQDIGSCLSRQVAKACESVVINAVKKLI